MRMITLSPPCASLQGVLSLLLISIPGNVVVGDLVIGGGGGKGSGGIVIGIGGGVSPPPETSDCPPPPPCPPPPSSPPPLVFESKELEIVYPVIQNFKSKIKSDPKGITRTWVGPDICSYQGFICDAAPDLKQKALAGVDFNGFLFAGPNLGIDGFIDKLPDIAIFHANSNFFTGTIPDSIWKLRYLYELDLSNNQYSGELPSKVLGAPLLLFLDLRFDSFSGTIPPQLFALNILDVIFINNNNFLGQTLPENLGSTKARYITFANSKFRGPIPRSIGNAAETLTEVLFLNNFLSGCLPSEIGLLNKATVFDGGQNQLTGPIPHSFGCLERMQILNLAQNQLYGPVPEVIFELPYLMNLSLSSNYFTQVGPECRELIKKGVLDVRNNCIDDLPNQRSPVECAVFFSRPSYFVNSSLSENIPCSKWYFNLSQGDHKANMSESVAAGSPPRAYRALVPHQP